MTPASMTWLAVGTALGVSAAVVSETNLPQRDDCVTYKVARKSVVSYVLRPPFQPAPVFEPPMVEPAKVAEAANEPQPVAAAEPEPEEKPRRRYRHMRRHRRSW